MAVDQKNFDQALAYALNATTAWPNALRLIAERDPDRARKIFNAAVGAAELFLDTVVPGAGLTTSGAAPANDMAAGAPAPSIDGEALAAQAEAGDKKAKAVSRNTFEFSVLAWILSKGSSYVHKRDALEALTAIGLRLGGLQAFSNRLDRLKEDKFLEWAGKSKLQRITITQLGQERLIQLSAPGQVRDADRELLIKSGPWAADLLMGQPAVAS
jgi:hypothetical protein